MSSLYFIKSFTDRDTSRTVNFNPMTKTKKCTKKVLTESVLSFNP
ncbi:hypothetical protein LMG9449_1740 [Lactococcus lactis subsp. lactis]|uniref:Uncharacterized protein n=1 Tax=Lactococcus lactis subsp. lactis TaxID=1360 RepID=A0A0V8AJG3_LACLL|nr:hypothetical protein ATCC19435_2247 [Lactococcus lactis subsp. lactis]KST80766.1 hypothetical protein LK231_0437 [Lactococcus lactis subsp. lactis]KSU17156.1 hypothetical protein LMG9449_1740 [Lactococcus lactis subsp. lactis]PCS19056.1 hypothetical protein RU91_GL000074 [Lactococcus lactis subsp. lactis]CDI46692.1 hypothetical protein BN927_00944 [Lactococcus lactis subsp. lactis Dephy 1]